MNEAHFHLAVNHLPIIIPGIAALVLAGGFIVKSEIVKRTAYFIFIFGCISTFIAMNSGEGAEHIVEEMGVSHDLIHEHEEAAELFAWVSHALGLLSIFGLWANWKHKRYSNMVAFATFAVCIFAMVLARQTGTTGGEIMHKEIRADFKAGAEEAHEGEYDAD